MGGITAETGRAARNWPGVEANPHRFGGDEFRAQGHEIGHLHGNYWADLPLPVHAPKELVARGKALLHHAVLPRPVGSATPSEARTTLPGC